MLKILQQVFGIFNTNQTIVGNTSNAQYTISGYNRQQFDGGFEDINNNIDVENEANSIINFDTQNPFGTP